MTVSKMVGLMGQYIPAKDLKPNENDRRYWMKRLYQLLLLACLWALSAALTFVFVFTLGFHVATILTAFFTGIYGLVPLGRIFAFQELTLSWIAMEKRESDKKGESRVRAEAERHIRIAYLHQRG